VTTAGGTSATSSADRFTYVPRPTVTKVSPNEGPVGGGTAVMITGTNLSGGSVKFGSAAATGVSCTTTECKATSPAGAGTVDVTVTTVRGASATSSADQFTYRSAPPAPTVTKLSPKSGPVGGKTKVKITGTNFASGATVKFGNTPATGVSCGATACNVESPAHLAGKVDVTVTTAGGTSAKSSADLFKYKAKSAKTSADRFTYD